MWEEVSEEFMEIPFYIALYIIEDALCYGFEFKVENYKLYFRETE